ncbi:MAG: hypothetical protein ABIO44_04275, partial [Saprospiraceae bacterium]
ELILNSDQSLSVNNIKVIFHNPLKIVLGEYNQSLGFNNQMKAHKVSVYFKKELKTSIYA